MTASARSTRTRPRPGPRPIEPAPFDDGLFGHVLITFALGGTILGVCALIDQWALGWTLASATVLFCLALIHRQYHRDLIRYAAAQALIGLAVSTTAPGRPPGRGWARRWTGGWVGHPRRLTLHFAPDLDAENMAWQQELLPLLARRFGVDYRITKVDMRRCRLNLRERPTTTQAEADPLHTRATEVAGLLLGGDAKSTINCDDAGSLTSVEASYTTNPRMASGNYRARIEAVFSAMLPGRWRARWDIENNQVRFEIRAQMPHLVPRPPVPATPDPDRIPLAVGEDGQLISWHLRGTAPHLMLAGKTGTGKTSGIIGVVLEAAARGWPVWACDPKRVEFLGLRNWPNVQIVATTTENQIAVIHAAWREMESRYSAIEAGDSDESAFTPLILVLDEYRDFVGAATDFYAGVKRSGMPSKCPVFEKISSLARKGRTARIHLVLGTQRPDAEFLGGEMRDNFNTRMSFGRLSPQGAQMMWENASIGVSVPNRVAGRGVGVTEDDEPVEIQCYYTPDPRRAKTAQDLADLEQFQPPTVTHPPLSVRPLQHLLDGEGPPMIWEAYANAELVPADPTEKPEPGLPPDVTESPIAPDFDGGYGPPQRTRADHLQPGDLILIDEGWVVVEIAEADVLDDSITDIDWRSDDDTAGSLSTPTTTTFDTRREEIE